jgi:hypothetical protein
LEAAVRQLEISVLDEESVRELSSGQRVQLTFGNVTVAEIVPTELAALANQQRQKEEARNHSRTALLEIMNRGIDMGGFKITNRDELYDRD